MVKTCRAWTLQKKFSERKSDNEDEHGISVITDSRGDVYGQRVTARLVMANVGEQS